jgi:hypothetical protein
VLLGGTVLCVTSPLLIRSPVKGHGRGTHEQGRLAA